MVPDRLFCCLRAAVLLAVAAPTTWAADMETDWQAIVALDSGPRAQARSPEELRAAIAAHMAAQERALRAFVAAHSASPHGFEARLRLARLLGSRGDFEGSETARAESRRMLAELEKGATRDQRAELDFTRVTALMRRLRAPTDEQRRELHAAARKFQSDHPADRRVAALLAEVATLFDAQPKTKRTLLQDAQALAVDDETRSRTADDLKRLDLLGTRIALEFSTPEGKAVDVADYRGKVVLLVFFASWSPPSRTALTTIRRAAEKLPRDRVQLLGVSLDEKREPLAAVMREQGILWPVAFDGQGWESPVVRSLGINALPTAWLLDKQGRLRSLKALESTEAQVLQLLNERGQ